MVAFPNSPKLKFHFKLAPISSLGHPEKSLIRSAWTLLFSAVYFRLLDSQTFAGRLRAKLLCVLWWYLALVGTNIFIVFLIFQCFISSSQKGEITKIKEIKHKSIPWKVENIRSKKRSVFLFYENTKERFVPFWKFTLKFLVFPFIKVICYCCLLKRWEN